MIAGTVGGGGRLEYTVVGDAVNVAQRLQSEAEGGEIVAAASTVDGRARRRVRVDRTAPREGPRGAGGGVPCRRRLTRYSRTAAADPARWPWVVLAGFFVATAVAGWSSSYVNDESLGTQIPYVVAFAMFGSWARSSSVVTAATPIGCCSSGSVVPDGVVVPEWRDLHVRRRAADRPGGGSWSWGSSTTTGGCSGSCPPSSCCRCCSPTGTSRRRGGVCSSGSPSRSWSTIAIDLTLGQRTLTGSGDATIANPLYVDAVGRLPTLDPVIARLVPGDLRRIRSFPSSCGSVAHRASSVNRSSGSCSGCSWRSSAIIATSFSNTRLRRISR